MTGAYNVVDADGHILEPLDLWDKYMDPEFRERRSRFVIDENGKERLDGGLVPFGKLGWEESVAFRAEIARRARAHVDPLG